MIEEDPITRTAHFDIAKAMSMLFVIATLLLALVFINAYAVDYLVSQAAIGQCVATVGEPVEPMDKAP